jgi:hypothetical protein
LTFYYSPGKTRITGGKLKLSYDRLNEYQYQQHRQTYHKQNQKTYLPISTHSAKYYLSVPDSRLLTTLPGLPDQHAAAQPQSKDPLDNFFQAKRINLARSLEDITGLIQQREQIKENNLHKIALGECELLTKLHNMDQWYLGKNPVIDKRRAIFEKELMDFDKQRRMEETSAWKDILTLKGELRELAQDLYKEQSRHSLFYGGI